MCRIAYVNTVSGERTYASHTQHVPHVSVCLSIFLSLSLSLHFLCLSVSVSSLSLSLSLTNTRTFNSFCEAQSAPSRRTRTYADVCGRTARCGTSSVRSSSSSKRSRHRNSFRARRVLWQTIYLILNLGKVRNTVAVCPLYCP